MMRKCGKCIVSHHAIFGNPGLCVTRPCGFTEYLLGRVRIRKRCDSSDGCATVCQWRNSYSCSWNFCL